MTSVLVIQVVAQAATRKKVVNALVKIVSVSAVVIKKVTQKNKIIFFV
jgi:hypothetical protein